MALESMPHNSPFLQKLGKYASALEMDYFKSMIPNIKRGDFMYNFGGAVKPKYAKGGISTKLWSQGVLCMKLSGYKELYVRATNRITTKLISSFGGVVVKTINI